MAHVPFVPSLPSVPSPETGLPPPPLCMVEAEEAEGAEDQEMALRRPAGFGGSEAALIERPPSKGARRAGCPWRIRSRHFMSQLASARPDRDMLEDALLGGCVQCHARRLQGVQPLEETSIIGHLS